MRRRFATSHRGVLSRWIGLGLAAAVVSGCGDNDMGELRDYIKEVKSRDGGRIEPIPEMESFETYRYPEDPGRDPFATLSFATPDEEKDKRAAKGEGPSPDRDRPKEPLEDFELDSLSYVGTVQQDGQLWGLIEDPGGTVHKVQTGDYMGTNYGEIQAVTPQGVELRELVRNQRGGWQKRQTSLALDE